MLTPEKLKGALTDKTRMLIFCNPSNPTGAVHSKVRVFVYVHTFSWMYAVFDVLHNVF